MSPVKTTIDIPDPLYRRAKIHAIEQGQSLKQIVVTSLEKELAASAEGATAKPQKSYWANRKLLPEYAKAVEEGAFLPRPGDRDITELISEDRDDR